VGCAGLEEEEDEQEEGEGNGECAYSLVFGVSVAEALQEQLDPGQRERY
jgi:hypothetical protein